MMTCCQKIQDVGEIPPPSIGIRGQLPAPSDRFLDRFPAEADFYFARKLWQMVSAQEQADWVPILML